MHNVLLTVHKFLLVLNTFSQSIADVTFLILQTFFSNLSSYCKWGSLILYTLHCTTFSLYCRCNPPGAAYFSHHTANVTFLILQTLYSNQTPSPPAADVVILILYILLSHWAKFFSYCRCDPPGNVHILYSYCRCEFFDSADFLLTQHTSSFLPQMYPCYNLHFPLTHCTALSLYCRCNPTDIEYFSPRTADVTFFIMQTFPTPHNLCCNCRCSNSGTAQFLLTLHNLVLVLQMWQQWYCTLSPLELQMRYCW